MWQNFTVQMDPNHAWAQWTYEYAACYLIGPMIGGFVAGTVFNYKMQTMEDMDVYEPDMIPSDPKNFKLGGGRVIDPDDNC